VLCVRSLRDASHRRAYDRLGRVLLIFYNPVHLVLSFLVMIDDDLPDLGERHLDAIHISWLDAHLAVHLGTRRRPRRGQDLQELSAALLKVAIVHGLGSELHDVRDGGADNRFPVAISMEMRTGRVGSRAMAKIIVILRTFSR
jgi:hypothetical protein